jgi:hypothetical protein
VAECHFPQRDITGQTPHSLFPNVEMEATIRYKV